MCRFIAYIGHPIILYDVLFRPKNSLIQQSIHAKETREPLNGDGFGLGWYIHDIENTPAIFKSINPAWNDQNLRHLAGKIRTTCFLAHVRAASTGDINYTNTHPFIYKDMLFQHNGDIGGFGKIKRSIRRSLSDGIYNWIQGQTDSEHFFAMILDILQKKQLPPNAETISESIIEALANLKQFCAEQEVTETTYLNAVVTQGNEMVAIRYISNPKDFAPSLHYSTGSRFEFNENVCHIRPVKEGEGPGALLVVSEKLTGHKAEWQEIPVNHMLTVDKNLQATLRPV